MRDVQSLRSAQIRARTLLRLLTLSHGGIEKASVFTDVLMRSAAQKNHLPRKGCDLCHRPTFARGLSFN